MRLSEAMMLGSVTCKLIPADWNSCAFGCAGNAVGIEQASAKGHGSQVLPDGRMRLGVIREYWPWLSNSELFDSIWRMFDCEVCFDRTKTLEQVADYVRSIEPSCGECNRFDCTCKPAEVAEAIEVHTHA